MEGVGVDVEEEAGNGSFSLICDRKSPHCFLFFFIRGIFGDV